MKSFEKMFSILELFTMDTPSLSITEIQEKLGYPKSTVFRILDSMEKADYIVRNEDNHRYSLGINFFRLGSIVQNQLDVRRVALPFMNEIVRHTKETAELNVLDETSRVCIEKVDSPLDVRNFVRIGERKEAHLGASGKVLIAFLEDQERKHVVNKIGTEHDINKTLFTKDLDQIRKDGYAITKGERVPGSYAIAVPIIDYTGTSIASLTIAGPIQRLSASQEIFYKDLLMSAARNINKKMGNFQIV
ncbi:hypothetical protein AV656_07910 [Bhargavaea cecembensis]|uniref:Glycerol operon regulatory protein n=1 Tax=Bhargavaea cecembensis TaxID=394098 RepID=A0A165H5B6_9BACL|nr:IclR family transcriptional regulator [Bhargavaea cecembensis]KZE38818.1 hypothetical protein AV656_07910 [Bhargavaea cecembensis]